MEKTTAIITELYTGTSHYISLKTKAVKLEMYERLTSAISAAIHSIIIAGLIAFGLLCFNVALSIWLGERLSSYPLGFAIVGSSYIVIAGLYLIIKNNYNKTPLKNIVLFKLSRSMRDYNTLLKTQNDLDKLIAESEIKVTIQFNSLKDQLKQIKEDIDSLKSKFTQPGAGMHQGSLLQGVATGAVEFFINGVLLKKAGILKSVVPVIANAMITSKWFKEKKRSGLLGKIGSKIFRKFL